TDSSRPSHLRILLRAGAYTLPYPKRHNHRLIRALIPLRGCSRRISKIIKMVNMKIKLSPIITPVDPEAETREIKETQIST
ncbi:Uncharacterized protein DAT39_020152, partial [Clarias magur]